MAKKANVFYALFTTILIATGIPAAAGVLENLDQELTDLVKSAEPYLVTIEAENQNDSNVYVGSGVLLDSDGYVTTTTSVIDRADKIEVSFRDGDKYDARYIGADYQTGLALLKIPSVERQTPKLGDPYKLNKGSWIIVIGNSYDMPNAVTFGVFSGLTDEGFLQLSVQSGPGSSGGAVFNARGELIGLVVAQASETVALHLPFDTDVKLNTRGYSSGGQSNQGDLGVDLPSSGTSLAVPADKISNTASQLIEFGEVYHGFLGIKQKALNHNELDKLGIAGGVEVTDISKDSPAQKAGLMKDDIIIKLDGRPIKGTGHLYSMVRSHKPDDEISLDLIRANSPISIRVVLGKAGNEGYYGFLPSSMRDNSDFEQKLTDLKDQLSSAYATAKENFARLDSLKSSEEIAEIKKDLSSLNEHLNELSVKVDELTNELKNKK